MAYDLLNCADKEEASALARDLCGKNIDRQKETENIMDQIENDIMQHDRGAALIAASPSIGGGGIAWNEGVIGLVAGRLAEKYYKPVLVMTSSNGEIKGSGRSIPELNLAETLEECRSHLKKYGGHAMACGFSIEDKDAADHFIKEFNAKVAEKLSGKELLPRIMIEAELELSAIDEDLVTRLERFAPFGEDNRRPVFICREVSVLDIIFMGTRGQHLKLRVAKDRSSVLSALAFGRSENWNDLRINDKIDLVFYVDTNEFNGRKEIQLKIVDIKSQNTKQNS
jgi:single-stranded-DNA-specific exonuclease